MYPQFFVEDEMRAPTPPSVARVNCRYDKIACINPGSNPGSLIVCRVDTTQSFYSFKGLELYCRVAMSTVPERWGVHHATRVLARVRTSTVMISLVPCDRASDVIPPPDCGASVPRRYTVILFLDWNSIVEWPCLQCLRGRVCCVHHATRGG